MRKLMWMTIGFAASILLRAYYYGKSWTLLYAILCLLAFGGIILKHKKQGKAMALLIVGIFAGSLWFSGFDQLHLRPLRDLNGIKISTSAIVSDYGYETSRGTGADGRILLDGKQVKARIYVNGKKELSPGDQIEGTFYLRYTGPGGEKEATYHQGKGIYVLCFGQDDASILKAEKVPGKCFPAVIRRNIQNLIDKIFPENASGFAKALLLGDDSGLSEETDENLKASGIRHVVAVSGLHVSILFGLVYFLSGRRRILTAVLGIPILLIFAAIAGFTPSIVRASVMQILMIVALLFNREYDPPTALSFAVLVLLAGNPMVITSVGFQLSVGCIIGILLISEPIRSYLMDKKRLGRWSAKSFMGKFCRFVTGSVSVTLGAMLLTVPLCSIYFGSVSLIGILTNLLTLWAVSIVFYGIIFSCILGMIWMPAGAFLAKLVSILIRYCLFVSAALAKIPLASIYTDNVYIGAWILFCYVVVVLFAISRKKHPWILTGCILTGFAVSILCVKLEPQTGNFCVSVLDVGQGQCVLLRNEDRVFLVDCGSERKGEAAKIAAKNLWSQGIDSLDGLILTHFDSDHVNGTEGLTKEIPVEELYLPNIYDDNGLREEIEEQNRGNITWVEDILTLQIPDGVLTIIPSHEGNTDNDSGLCVLFQPSGYDILITGDRGFAGEKELMEDVDLPQLELLVVGHHGSRYSTGLDFLRETRPSAAAISAGKNNRYGHPAQETLDKLEIFQCQVFRTDLDGTITFRGDH